MLTNSNCQETQSWHTRARARPAFRGKVEHRTSATLLTPKRALLTHFHFNLGMMSSPSLFQFSPVSRPFLTIGLDYFPPFAPHPGYCNLVIRLTLLLNLNTSTLKMEAEYLIESSVAANKSTRSHNPEDHNLSKPLPWEPQNLYINTFASHAETLSKWEETLNESGRDTTRLTEWNCLKHFRLSRFPGNVH